MARHRILKGVGWAVLTLTLLFALLIAFFDWNWLRGPAMRKVTEDTGRQFVINGDLRVHLGWPLFRVHMDGATFANPSWAKQPQMIVVKSVDFSIDMLKLLRRQIAMPDVRLTEPAVALEISADGRKNWLLDKNQRDESTRIPIGRLTIDRGRIAFDDDAQKTSIDADVSTNNTQHRESDTSVTFSVSGRYKDLPLEAHGSGGPVLALQNQSQPYPIKIAVAIGPTGINADGRITNLSEFSAVDMQIDLRGDSMASLYPIIGIALPDTHPYHTNGRLVHDGKVWRYQDFTGHVGGSDLAGTLQVDTSGKRPFMHGDLESKSFDFADLGPVIGTSASAAAHPEKIERPGPPPSEAKGKTQNTAATPSDTQQPESPSAEKRMAATDSSIKKSLSREIKQGTRTSPPADSSTKGPNPDRALPQIPFNTDRWLSVDADVKLSAHHIHREKALPIENLVTRIRMNDALLTLDPLDFGIANGHLAGTISLDGRGEPIQTHAKMSVRKLMLNKMFPTLKLNNTSFGQINGDFDLKGQGDAVAKMLATSNGTLTLMIAGGQISRLMMEIVGLHILEILQLKLTGDQVININCGVADFRVKNGLMNTNLLLLDTDITSLFGDGTVNLANERMNLVINQKTKKTSPVSLRSPIYVRGTFSHPDVGIDKKQVVTRSLGAIALGALSPVLSLIPLFDPGEKGFENECAKILHQAPPELKGKP